ncbi:hypothetical protein T459_09814 [Capsicum annuum]|uniref:Uncharacterized protein n=1 Tax=Capsicum annuum TaxID=4072 RepID=A0A2G3A0H3_CAPAN|nr:hypothetical protein T459_09814 [Capsicum annuum]
MKHISPKLFYTHDLQKNGDINMQQIRSSDNVTDLFTKPPPIATFKKMVHKIRIARRTNQEQISGIEVDLDKEKINDVDDFDKEHFINLNDEGSDESDDSHDMNSLMFPKPSLKRQLSTDDIGTTGRVKQNEEDEELEKVSREQDKEWMTLCQLAVFIDLSSSDDSDSDSDSGTGTGNGSNRPKKKRKSAQDVNFALPLGFLDPLPPPKEPPLQLPAPPTNGSNIDLGSSVSSCKQFWKAGDYEGNSSSSVLTSGGIDHVRVHPKFLHSNATSHKWVLGAFAELLDNALDEV